MLTVEKLKELGVDTADGLNRCLNMEDFYLELVNTAINDPQFDKLESALKAGDLDRAFEYAHALKGVYSNLSLTPLTVPVSEITELLRSRTGADYSALLGEARTALDKLKELAG